jgi:hypothetical protein
MKRIPSKLQPWFETRKRFKLSHAVIQMARELGMNPKGFGKLDNHRQERWKLPLAQFIEECYERRFGKPRPEHVRTLEQIILAEEERKKRKQLANAEKSKLATTDEATEISTGKDCANDVEPF